MEQLELQITVKIEEDGSASITSKTHGSEVEFINLVAACTGVAAEALANLYTAHLVLAGYEDSEALRGVFLNNVMPSLRRVFKEEVDSQLSQNGNIVIVRGDK